VSKARWRPSAVQLRAEADAGLAALDPRCLALVRWTDLMSASRFDEVARLPESEQRRLLAHGDAPERLWAAWSLALEIGRDVIPELRLLEQDAVPDGLRCQLLVILAGLGQRELLETIARADASDRVRAVAATLYVRTGSRHSDSDVFNFARVQLRAAPAVVRRAILSEQQVGNLSLPAEDLLPTLADTDVETRVLSAACLLAGGEGPEILGAVVEAYLAERNPEVRADFLRALPRAASSDVLAAAARRGSSTIVEALNGLHELYGQLTWTEVACLCDVTTVVVGRTILACGVHPEPPNGLRWLCRLLRLVLADQSSVANETRWRCLSSIEQSLTEGASPMLEGPDKQLLRSVFEALLAESRAEVETNGPDSDDEVYLEDLERVVRLLQ
jgi:hypothetical protein